MKAFYNNSDRLIAFKGDREPVQIYTKGQLVSNISAVPLSLPTTASGASFSPDGDGIFSTIASSTSCIFCPVFADTKTMGA